MYFFYLETQPIILHFYFKSRYVVKDSRNYFKLNSNTNSLQRKLKEYVLTPKANALKYI